MSVQRRDNGPPWRLCTLITELGVGGAQKVLADVVTALPRERYQVLATCLFGAGETATRLRQAGIEVVDLDMRSKADLAVVWRLWRLLRQFRPHSLHTHMFHASLLGRVAGRLAGVPHIVGSEHTMGQEGRLRRLVNRLTSPLTDRVIAVSESVGRFAREVIRIAPGKVVVIPNGIEPETCRSSLSPEQARRRFGLPEKALVVGTVGGLRRVKGTDLLLRAFARLRAGSPQARLLIVGDGPEWERLHALAEALGIREVTTFTGTLAGVADPLAAMTVFVLPSHWEGFGLAVVEAMAAGRPVVVTQVGSLPEVVGEGKCGLLVPPNDPEAMAAAIAQLLDDPDLRSRLAQAGRERVQALYTREVMVARTEALYRELIAGVP